MTTQLEIKHLSPYLPYGLKVWHSDWKTQLKMNATGSESDSFSIDDVIEFCDIVKPLLLPLSELTKKITIGSDEFVPMERLFMAENQGLTIRYEHKRKVLKRIEMYAMHETFDKEEHVGAVVLYRLSANPYWMIEKLLEWHFDVFGLIESGLALNKLEIEK